jgi:hypothetical protein
MVSIIMVLYVMIALIAIICIIDIDSIILLQHESCIMLEIVI